MSDDYTPTTEQVRRYWQYGANAWADGVAHNDDVQADGTSIGAEFDRWLAAHVAKALEEAGRAFTHAGEIRGGALFTRREVEKLLRGRAAEIRKGAAS